MDLQLWIYKYSIKKNLKKAKRGVFPHILSYRFAGIRTSGRLIHSRVRILAPTDIGACLPDVSAGSARCCPAGVPQVEYPLRLAGVAVQAFGLHQADGDLDTEDCPDPVVDPLLEGFQLPIPFQ